MPDRKRILIVGAGSSGLTAIKACLEDDLQPVCLEKTLDIGGLWNYSPEPSAPGTAGIYRSLVINTCKEMTAFSDFPIPTHFPKFLSHQHVMDYFRMYLEHFRLLPHIRFNAEVRHIRPAEDYGTTGRWTVRYIQHVVKTCPMKCASLDLCKDHEKRSRHKSARDMQRMKNSADKTNDKNNPKDFEPLKNPERERNQEAMNGSKPSSRDITMAQSGRNNPKATNSIKPNTNKETTSQIIQNDKDATDSPNQETIDQCEANCESEKIHTNGDNNDPTKTNQPRTRDCEVSKNIDKALPAKLGTADTATSQEPEEAVPQIEQNSSICQEMTEDFDGVMICTGHHTVPYVPEFPGLASFQGQIIHSQDYKRPEPFTGRRVLIIGIGNSAVDIAADLAKTAGQVYLSTRRGSWVLSRSVGWGVPADMVANSRVVNSLPSCLLQWLVEKQANLRMDHHRLGLSPPHRLLGAHPTINEEIPFHLMTRRVEVCADVSRILPQGVQFTDGSLQEVDVIIMATGYDYRLDFVDPRVLKVIDNRAKLYKYVFPPHLPHATLAVIGLVQAIGAVMPIAELQSRWFVSLMMDRVQLPERNRMEKDILQKEKEMNSQYYRSRRHTLQTPWVQYMDEVAVHIGAKPDLWRMMLTQPSLAVKCYLGPCLPAQYRLQGPHPWPHAPRFIRSVWTRYAHRPKTTRDPNLRIHLTPDDSATNTHSEERTAGNNPATSQSDVDIDVDADVKVRQSRHRKSPNTMTSTRQETSHPAFLLPPRSERGEGGVWEWCRGVVFYLYVLVVAVVCVVWLQVRFLGEKEVVKDVE